MSTMKSVAQSVGNGLNSLADRLWPEQKHIGAGVSSFVRGAIWATVLIVSIVIPTLIAAPFYSGLISADDGLRAAVLLALSGAGMSINLVDIPDLLAGQMLTAQLAVRPTLITLLLVIIAYRFGQKLSASETSNDRRFSRFGSWSLGLGFASAVVTASWAVQGTVNYGGVAVRVGTVDSLDVLWAWALVAVPAWLGTIRQTNRVAPKTATFWAWGRSAAGYFVVLYSAILLAFGIYMLIIGWIEPDFADVTPAAAISNPLEGVPAIYVWSAIAGIALTLPTLLFWALAVGTGGSIGVDLGSAPTTVMNIVSPLLNQTPITSFGLGGATSTMVAYYVAIALTVIVSLLAGVIAAIKWDVSGANRATFLKISLSTIVAAFVVMTLTNWGFAWDYVDTPSTDVTAGVSTLVESGEVKFGATLVSVSIVAALISAMSFIGVRWSMKLITDAFPRIVSTLSGQKIDRAARGLVGRILGTVVSLAVVVAVTVPVVIVTTERVWGSIDGPSISISKIADIAQGDDIEKIKESYSGGSDSLNWFSDEILLSAKPSAEMERELTVGTKFSEAWEVGNLSAIGHVKWLSDNGDILMEVPATAKLETIWGGIDHAVWSAQATAGTVNVEIGEFLKAINPAEIDLKVNGITADVGKYNAIPGRYVFTSAGYKLIAPSEVIVNIGSKPTTVTLGTEALLPQGADAKLNDQIKVEIDKCSNISTSGQNPCVTGAAISSAAEITKGTKPATSFSSHDVGFSASNVKCEDDFTDALTSAISIKRTQDCTMVIKFQRQFHDSAERRVPVYETREYDACPDEWWHVCWTSVQVQVGTSVQKIEGAIKAKVDYLATVSFTVSVIGRIDGKGTFSVK